MLRILSKMDTYNLWVEKTIYDVYSNMELVVMVINYLHVALFRILVVHLLLDSTTGDVNKNL